MVLFSSHSHANYTSITPLPDQAPAQNNHLIEPIQAHTPAISRNNSAPFGRFFPFFNRLVGPPSTTGNIQF